MCSPMDIKQSSDMEIRGQEKNGSSLRLCLHVGQGLSISPSLSLYLSLHLSIYLSLPLSSIYPYLIKTHRQPETHTHTHTPCSMLNDSRTVLVIVSRLRCVATLYLILVVMFRLDLMV